MVPPGPPDSHRSGGGSSVPLVVRSSIVVTSQKGGSRNDLKENRSAREEQPTRTGRAAPAEEAIPHRQARGADRAEEGRERHEELRRRRQQRRKRLGQHHRQQLLAQRSRGTSAVPPTPSFLRHGSVRKSVRAHVPRRLPGEALEAPPLFTGEGTWRSHLRFTIEDLKGGLAGLPRVKAQFLSGGRHRETPIDGGKAQDLYDAGMKHLPSPPPRETGDPGPPAPQPVCAIGANGPRSPPSSLVPVRPARRSSSSWLWRRKARRTAFAPQGARTYDPRGPSRGGPTSDGPLPVRDRPLDPARPRGAAGGAQRTARRAPELPPGPRGLVPPPRDATEGRSIGRRPGDPRQGAREFPPVPRDDRAGVDDLAPEDPRAPPDRRPEGIPASAAEGRANGRSRASRTARRPSCATSCRRPGRRRAKRRSAARRPRSSRTRSRSSSPRTARLSSCATSASWTGTRSARRSGGRGGRFEFRVEGVRTWTVDLSNGRPRVIEGASGDADVVLEVTEEDLRLFLQNPSRFEAAALAQDASLDDNASALVRLFALLRP